MRLSLRWTLVVGTAVRLLISPFFAHPKDILNWYDWTTSLSAGVFPGTLFVPPYPLAYVLLPFASLYLYVKSAFVITSLSIDQIPPILRPEAIWGVQVVPSPVFDFLIKIPFVMSDIAVAVVVYKIASDLTGEKTKATAAASLWFLNPYTIWVSSAWGMYDTIPALLTCLCLLALWKGRAFLAGAILMLAFSFKLYPVLLLPLFVLHVKRSSAPGTFLRNSSLLMGGFLVTGFVSYAEYLGQIGTFLGSVVASPNFTANFNRAGLPPGFGLTYWSLSSIIPMGGFIVPLSITASIILLGYVYYFLARQKFAEPLLELCASSVMVISAVLLTFRFVGENFVVWIMPFLSILVVCGRVRNKLFWSLSGIALFFSITNSLLPFYMLPDVPWIGGTLSQVMTVLQPYRSQAAGGTGLTSAAGSLYLVFLGIVFSFLMLALLYQVRAAMTLPRPTQGSAGVDSERPAI